MLSGNNNWPMLFYFVDPEELEKQLVQEYWQKRLIAHNLLQKEKPVIPVTAV
jgi:hypothetical protein